MLRFVNPKLVSSGAAGFAAQIRAGFKTVGTNLLIYFSKKKIMCFSITFFRLAEICAAIEEMERRQREAELRRLKAQNQEWIKDFKPEGAAEFGSMPSFRWIRKL